MEGVLISRRIPIPFALVDTFHYKAGIGLCQQLMDSLFGKGPGRGDGIDSASTVSTRRPLLVFVQDGIATALGCLAEPLCNLCRGCEIEPRHLVRLHSAELDETEHRAVTM